ncbi:hypothetical protein B4064_1813 [Caldibacillus thermoamylovorans]|uniref:Uncharacterized protein n=1 Tax=Caldibacillus thermoamylovorans TaxID=35841 RepID=A0A0D0FXY6_9BACI|nr:hypothetical protein B4166_0528 [Caldibacillus thermoamylovorans]KIO67011.1 hypothetical protein B4065_2041 [Caldibacillus thermoamylovorans]KIO68020.1 hypothetical protein B4064_1813 [Caldibacillus thermoamylovorans]KIO72216.1 hypothetical protein B4167_0573 [Caldibacillus thermoamylovorans]
MVIVHGGKRKMKVRIVSEHDFIRGFAQKITIKLSSISH